MFIITMSSAATTYIFDTASDENEAIEICNALDWEWIDDNGFVWTLDYYKN